MIRNFSEKREERDRRKKEEKKVCRLEKKKKGEEEFSIDLDPILLQILNPIRRKGRIVHPLKPIQERLGKVEFQMSIDQEKISA